MVCVPPQLFPQLPSPTFGRSSRLCKKMAFGHQRKDRACDFSCCMGNPLFLHLFAQRVTETDIVPQITFSLLFAASCYCTGSSKPLV